MKALTCITILGLAAFSCYGQTIAFKGQLLDNNNNVVKNYSIIINGKQVTTDYSGVFSTPINTGDTQLDIKTSDKSYVIAYPIGGKVLVPKDPSLLTQIVVEGFQSNSQIKKYLASVSGLKEAAKKGQSATNALQAKIDSLAANLQKIGYTNDDLRLARERQDGIDLFYPEIGGSLQDFIYQGQMLMTAFKTISTDAFKTVSALTQYGQTQASFKQAYEKLYLNYPTYSKKMSDYWDDPTLATEFAGIADTLLNGISKNKIEPLNDVKNRVNQYFQTKLSNNDKDKLKKDIQSQIATQIPPIVDQLNAMESRVKQFLIRLKD